MRTGIPNVIVVAKTPPVPGPVLVFTAHSIHCGDTLMYEIVSMDSTLRRVVSIGAKGVIFWDSAEAESDRYGHVLRFGR